LVQTWVVDWPKDPQRPWASLLVMVMVLPEITVVSVDVPARSPTTQGASLGSNLQPLGLHTVIPALLSVSVSPDRLASYSAVSWQLGPVLTRTPWHPPFAPLVKVTTEEVTRAFQGAVMSVLPQLMEVKAQVPLIGQLSGFPPPLSLHPVASPATPSRISAKKPVNTRAIFMSSVLHDLLFEKDHY
jgi:hypothetical protein